jgi:osmotically-inducible protein OsmY
MIRVLSVLCLLCLSACGPEMLFFGTSGSGVVLSKEKTVGSTVDDTTIWTKIKTAFLSHNKEVKGIITEISVEVSEGRVLLTGKVETAEERLKVIQIVWEQAGVKEVLNEIKLTGEEQQKGNYAADAWITTQVKSKLLANNKVRSMNYNVETINKVVYVLGIARTEEEMEQVLISADSVKNVNKVVNYVRVKTDHQVDNKKETKEKDFSDAQKDNLKNLDDSQNESYHENEPYKDPNHEAEPSSSKKRVEYLEPEDDQHVVEIGQDTE